jgi:hypothetical protein
VNIGAFSMELSDQIFGLGVHIRKTPHCSFPVPDSMTPHIIRKYHFGMKYIKILVAVCPLTANKLTEDVHPINCRIYVAHERTFCLMSPMTLSHVEVTAEIRNTYHECNTTTDLITKHNTILRRNHVKTISPN